MLSPDTIPAWFAVPACLVLCIAWRRQEARARYWTLDCLDGKHGACDHCSCHCHSPKGARS